MLNTHSSPSTRTENCIISALSYDERFLEIKIHMALNFLEIK